MKTKKRKKSSRMHGKRMGTHGRGARKKAKGKGHRGGKGMSGSGKRADHKKTLITKKYGNKYFGKQGVTSRKTEKDKRKRINLQDITNNLEKYKKTSKGYEINLPEYKILGKGDVNQKLIINARKASKSALEKVRKKGGEIIQGNKKPSSPGKEKEQPKDNKNKKEK